MYVKSVPSPQLTKEQLREIFVRFDKNKDKLLSKSELKEAFNYLGSLFPWYRANRCVAQADYNGDGLIDSDELKDAIIYASKLGYTVK